MLSEEFIIYAITILISVLIVVVYIIRGVRRSKRIREKIEVAKAEGRFEPVSLHPYIDPDNCIGSGACVRACPEQDILGLVDGRAMVINASSCIGHGACFHACPVEAISLRIGTERRGVELPHIGPDFETNVPGIYIAGELGGMGLIKNSAEQGVQAVTNIAGSISDRTEGRYDLAIIGAGPAGIAASLTAKMLNLNFITLEQDTLGGTVFTFPRTKVVMTKPMTIPLMGKVKLVNTSKEELLSIWKSALYDNGIVVREHSKVDAIHPGEHGGFELSIADQDPVTASRVLIAIGRRGTPRKLGVPGEVSTKVAYRLPEPETIINQKVLVVGGGDSAVEAALLLMDQNEVSLSYRKETFGRIKSENQKNLDMALEQNKLRLYLNTVVSLIDESTVQLKAQGDESLTLPNDRIFIFAGGELPTAFLGNAGIRIEKRFGKIMKKH